MQELQGSGTAGRAGEQQAPDQRAADHHIGSTKDAVFRSFKGNTGGE